MENLKILIVDDEIEFANEVAEFISEFGHKVMIAGLPSKAFDALKHQSYDLAIVDIRMPEMNGIEFLKKVRQEYPNMEVIMITGHGDMDTVIQSLRLGALDFINKPFGSFEIQSAIERSKRFLQLNAEYKEVKKHYEAASRKLKKIYDYQIIGKSTKIKNVIHLMAKVAKTPDTPVLIIGESGTGKELVARGIHNLSVRKNQDFYDVNCSVIPEHLFESELFGHKKGSFTGALQDKPGWFEIANHGTLFLDEISDMPMNQQVKLLRVLEQKKIRRVGAVNEINVDVRILAATNTDMEEQVKKGKFRLDLFHRLNAFAINVPPLNERKNDIPLLIDHFVAKISQRMRKKISKVNKNIIQKLYNYDFPGNIRELKNMVEKAIIITDSENLEPKHFTIYNNYTLDSVNTFDLEKLEKEAIKKALKITRYKKEAAELLHITQQSLLRRIKKYKL